jgi:LacI family transcriptional regulator
MQPMPTAVVCGNDVLALGAHIEAAALGIPVPRDLSIVGIDDLEFASHLSPPLTTLSGPATEMGRLAARQIMSRLIGEPVPDHVRLEAKLIVRGTTDRCRNPATR